MNSKSIGLAVVALVLIGGGYLLSRDSESDQPVASATPTPTASPSVVATTSPSPTLSGLVQGTLKTFAVSGSSFTYEPKVITVRKGDTVKIVFTNTEGFHDWVIDEFSARTTKIQAGKTETIEFVADKAGSFQYYCSVGNHRAAGMWGTLVVQ